MLLEAIRFSRRQENSGAGDENLFVGVWLSYLDDIRVFLVIQNVLCEILESQYLS